MVGGVRVVAVGWWRWFLEGEVGLTTEGFEQAGRRRRGGGELSARKISAGWGNTNTSFCAFCLFRNGTTPCVASFRVLETRSMN